MPAFTLKQIPEGLMRRLRREAQRNRRSVSQEMLNLLDRALEQIAVEQADRAGEKTLRYGANRGPVKEPATVDRETQLRVWRELSGQWRSDQDPDEELEAIYGARTAGREVEL